MLEINIDHQKLDPEKSFLWRDFGITTKTIGVRGGGRGWAAATSGLKNFRANSAFRAREIAQNSWMLKNMSIQWKISGQLCFSGQAQVAQKSWTIKNIHSIQWIQGTLCFSVQAQSCSKILNGEKSFSTVYSVYIHLGVIKGAARGGWRSSSPPLSNQNIDVYFLSFTPILQVEIGRIAEYSSAVPQGLATHLLTNQAVINFRDLRNIEAAFFIPAWFVLSSTTRTVCYRALPAWKQARHLNYQQCRLMCSLYVAKLRPSLCAHLDDMHQCYHFWCFERNFWCLMFWQQIWCWLSCCFFSTILYPFRMKLVSFIIFKFLSSISHSHVCLVIDPNWRSSLPNIGNNITRYAYNRFFHLMMILRSVSDSTWVIALC